MIQRMNLLHYLTKDTYEKICRRLHLDVNRAKGNIAVFDKEKIRKIELYNIAYQEFGHIWFMDAEVDFPKFACDYDMFGKALYDDYLAIFDEKIMAGFPPYDQLCCSYIEYASLLTLGIDSSDITARLKEKCAPEQLDKALWNQYKKSHGTIEFCVSVERNRVETLARCHGTALKKRVDDARLHRTVGLIPEAAVNKDTEADILSWLYKRYRITNIRNVE